MGASSKTPRIGTGEGRGVEIRLGSKVYKFKQCK